MYFHPIELPHFTGAQRAARMEEIRFDESVESFCATLPAVSRVTPTRKREFLAGRQCAAEALRSLSESPFVEVQPDRSPKWPTNVAGSISHTHKFVWAVVSSKSTTHSLGIDVERIFDPRTSSEVQDIVTTDSEVRRLEEMTGNEMVALTLAFSAKEAVYKCLAPLGLKDLDFLDVSLQADSEVKGQLKCRLPHNPIVDVEAVTVRYRSYEDHIFSFCSIPNRSSQLQPSLVA